MITVIFFIFLSFTPSLFADTVYFKDGKALKNVTTNENEKGIWIDGVLFEKQGVDRIEKKPVVKTLAFPKTSFFKKEKRTSQSAQSDIDMRIKKRAEEERRKAQIANEQAGQRARETKPPEEYKSTQPTSDSYSGMKRY